VLALLAATAGCRPRQPGREADDGDAGAARAEPSGAAWPGRLRLPGVPPSLARLVAEAAPAVVAIRATRPVKSGPAAMFPGAPEAAADPALGSGFLIQHRGSFVLTNDHVIAAAPEIRVVLPDGSELVAHVVGRDARLDLALLSVETPRLPHLPLGDSAELQVGEWVVVLGNPFGGEVTASAGIVAATGRHGVGSVLEGPASLYRTYLQTDARIHRGNSGGPVLDTAGQVVGVAVATGDRPGELSFAIPIDRVKEVLDALRDHGSVARAYLGAMVNQVPPELAAELPEAGGAIVTEVHAGSPAVRAGLRTGDVILRWDGTAVDHRALPALASAAVVGRKVRLTVWRAGGTVEVVVEPARAPD
jgi:serine protease Do